MYNCCLQSALMLIEFCFCYQNKWNLCQLKTQIEGELGKERKGEGESEIYLLAFAITFTWVERELRTEKFALHMQLQLQFHLLVASRTKRKRREEEKEALRHVEVVACGMQGICHKCQFVLLHTFRLRHLNIKHIHHTPRAQATNWAVAAVLHILLQQSLHITHTPCCTHTQTQFIKPQFDAC